MDVYYTEVKHGETFYSHHTAPNTGHEWQYSFKEKENIREMTLNWNILCQTNCKNKWVLTIYLTSETS